MDMKVLLIDDLRQPTQIVKKFGDAKSVIEFFTDEETHVARTYAEGMLQLTDHGPFDVLLLDNDLGSNKEGYHVLCMLEAAPELLPRTIILVTANPVRGAQMMQMLERFKEKGQIDAYAWRR